MRIETYTIGIDIDSRGVSRSLNKVDKQVKGIGNNLGNLKAPGIGGLGGLGKIGGLLGGLGIATVAKGFVTAAADIQKATIGVAKTIDGITEDQIVDLKKGLIDLGTSTSIPTLKLFEIAEVAGQLGLGAEDVLAFTDTIAKLDLATSDFKGGEAASTLKTILDLTGEGVENVDELASSFVVLGNSYNTTEGQAASLGIEIAKGLQSFNVGSDDIVAFSGALAEIKIPPELARSGIGALARELDLAFVKGGKDLKKFSKIAGVSGKDFEKIFKNNAADGINLFIKGLKEQQKQGISVTQSLDNLGLNGERFSVVIGGLVKQYDRMLSIQSDVNKEYENATALNNEAAEASKSFDSALGRLRNSFTKLAENIGSIILPALTGLVDGFNIVIEAINNAIERIKVFFSERKQRFFDNEENKQLEHLNNLIEKEAKLRERLKDSRLTPEGQERRRQELDETLRQQQSIRGQLSPNTTTNSTVIDKIEVNSSAESVSALIEDIGAGIVEGQPLPAFS